MSKTFSIVPLLFVPILACGGDDGKHITTPDAHTGSGSGSGSGSGNACKAQASYAPTFDGSNSGATDVPTMGSGSDATAHHQIFGGALNAADTDEIRLDLYAGYGGFGSGEIRPGAYQLNDTEADQAECGICFLLWPQVEVDSMGSITDDYYANEMYAGVSGSLQLDMAGGSAGTTLSGTLSNIGFKHINVGQSSQSYAADNCSSTVTTATFTATLDPASLAFTGKTDAGAPVRITLKHRHR